MFEELEEKLKNINIELSDIDVNAEGYYDKVVEVAKKLINVLENYDNDENKS